MKVQFELFLETYYSGSNLNAYFNEIVYNLHTRIQLYPKILSDYNACLKLSLDAFEDVFPGSDDEILVFISSWENFIPDEIQQCFKNPLESFTWFSMPMDSENYRLKKLIRVKRYNIDYHKALTIILNCEIKVEPQENIRIYFFNKASGKVYYNWDSLLEIGMPVRSEI